MTGEGDDCGLVWSLVGYAIGAVIGLGGGWLLLHWKGLL